MNHAELTLMVEQRQKEGKAWATIPLEDLKELLQGYRQFHGVPWPVADLQSE